MIFRGRVISLKNNVQYYFFFQINHEYNATIDSYVYCIEIWEEGLEMEDKFTVLLKIMDCGNDLKVVDLFPPDYYRGKGISIAIIMKAKELLNKRIISSSNLKKTYNGEMRWKDATEKVWERMVNQGLAKYDTCRDHYYTL